jgi:biopolymer transport protein ExbD
MEFGGFTPDDADQPTAEINMIPMIDVMLVLLIVFILAAPLLARAVKVDLPREVATADRPLPADITVSVDKAGQVWWENTPVTAAELDRRLDDEGRKADPPEVHIRADRDVTYGHVADLMALASGKGLHKLAFVSDPVPRQ